MKTMTCQQLGGACELAFHAETFDEMATLSQEHGKAMHQQGDVPHLQAMQAMGELMQSPQAMQQWMSEKRAAFDALPQS